MHHGFLGDACVARGQVTDLPLYLIRDSVCYEKRALVRQGKVEFCLADRASRCPYEITGLGIIIAA